MKRPRRHAKRVAPPSIESSYASHPRSLVAKRMMSGILQLVQTRQGTAYAPKYPGIDGILIERKRRISPTVLRKLASELRDAFWVVYRFDRETMLMAEKLWSDADLATYWGAWREGVCVWRLLVRPRKEVVEDWRQFCLVEKISRRREIRTANAR